MKYHEWMENNRKLTLSAQDDERLKSLLERDIQVRAFCDFVKKFVFSM